MEFKNLKAITQKSYYGKAKTAEINGEKLLKSYDTIVCKITANGDFVRLWGGYSRTTAAHVNDFRKLYGLPALNKKAWFAIPCENTGLFAVELTNGFYNYVPEVRFDSYDDAELYASELEQTHRNAYAFVIEA